MKDHAFYFGLMVLGFIVAAMFLPSNTLTGFSIQKCPDCGKLCDEDSECGGLTCCPTVWESGVCHEARSCAAIADVSMRQTYQQYANPEKPMSIHNIAWKNFGIPVLIILGLVAVIVYRARKH